MPSSNPAPPSHTPHAMCCHQTSARSLLANKTPLPTDSPGELAPSVSLRFHPENAYSLANKDSPTLLPLIWQPQIPSTPRFPQILDSASQFSSGPPDSFVLPKICTLIPLGPSDPLPSPRCCTSSLFRAPTLPRNSRDAAPRGFSEPLTPVPELQALRAPQSHRIPSSLPLTAPPPPQSYPLDPVPIPCHSGVSQPLHDSTNPHPATQPWPTTPAAIPRPRPSFPPPT